MPLSAKYLGGAPFGRPQWIISARVDEAPIMFPSTERMQELLRESTGDADAILVDKEMATDKSCVVELPAISSVEMERFLAALQREIWSV